MSNQITSGGHTPSTLAKLPLIRTFQMDAGGIGSIPNSVNLFRGDVHLPLELISLPGRGDLDVKVVIMYQSNVQKGVDTRNLEAPTGILGLGWAMPHEMIAIDKKTTGSTYDDVYYLISGGAANRLHRKGIYKGKGGNDWWELETDDYKPWEIRYYPKDERWVIIKENGLVHTYGGITKDKQADENPYIHWGVKWSGREGNWMDSSIETYGQEQLALAWNLAKIRNPWGDKVTLEYETDLEQIGVNGLSYTRACYLSRITDVCGRTLTFVYKSKRNDDKVREYQLPHEYTGQSNLHAYQDRYETKFLDHIEVRQPVESNDQQQESGALLFSVHFDYDFMNVSLDNFNNPNFFKRYLVGITQKNAHGKSLPGYRFRYFTEEDPDTHHGALKSIIYPEGGTASFTYEKKHLIGTAQKTTMYGNGIPRVWFGSDYVVVAYYDENATSDQLKLSIYTWNGNWISYEQSFSGKLDIDSLGVVPQNDFFALCFKTQNDMRVYLFSPEIGRFGKWDYQNFFLDLPSNEAQTLLSAGSNFVVACASGGNTLGRYVWNPTLKQWDDKSADQARKGGHALAAFGNYFTLGTYNADSKNCELTLYYLDEETRDWDVKDIGSLKIEADERGNPYLYWSLSSNSATATLITNIGTEVTYEVHLYEWNQEFKVSCPLKNSYRLPVETKEPFYYSIASGSLVGNLGHLWRYNGHQWKEGELRQPTGGEAPKYAYGSDLAIVSSADSRDVKAYDPFKDQWISPDIQDSWSKGEHQPTISGDFATIGNAIYHRNNQGQMEKIGSLPTKIKPDSIINRSPYYIACETEDGTVQVCLLKNGKVVTTEYLEANERILVDNKSKGKLGTMLAGFNTFVTYKGEDFDEATVLHLYRVINASVKEHLHDFPVMKVTINDGYKSTHTNYDYDTNTVTVGVGGIVTEYSQVTVVPGSDDSNHTPFGKTKHYFINGLDVEKLDLKDVRVKARPPFDHRFLHGMLFVKRDYDATGREISCEINHYEIVRERQDKEERRKTLYGDTVQLIGKESVLYGQQISSAKSNTNLRYIGVKRQVDYEYDPSTGLVTQETTYNHNGSGEKEILSTLNVYGWRKYDDLKKQNILTPVVQSTSKTKGKTTAVSVTTWKEWEKGKWGEHRVYKAKNEHAVFEHWDSQDAPPENDWLKISEMISRTEKGVVQDTVDMEEIHTSTLWDQTQLYPVAGFVNACEDEAIYVGFEEYERLGFWTMTGGNKKLEECIIVGDAHTGVRSLKLTPNLTFKLRATLNIAKHQSYILSAWIKTEAGFDEDKGKGGWKIMFRNDNRPVGDAMFVEVDSTGGEWKYWQCILRPEEIRGNQIMLEVNNHKSSTFLLLDDLRFSPLVCDFEANVYDPIHRIIIAKLGNNADTSRYVNDAFQRRVVEIGPCENINTLIIPYLTRQVNDSEDFHFPWGEPNCALNIRASEGGLYESFTSGAQWQQHWQSEKPENWKVENGALVYTGTEAGKITFKPTESLSNYGVRVSVQASVRIQSSFGISIGSQLKAQWTAARGWSLTIGTNPPIEETIPSTIPGEWILVAVNHKVLLYADGRQVFAEHTEKEISGSLQLFVGDEVAFKDVVVFEAPQVLMTYTDGSGKERQTQKLDGTDCLVREKCYDQMGRPAIETKAVRFKNTLFGYRERFVEQIDWTSGVLKGELATAYPQDEGYPYTRTVFEDSPLGREIKKGQPGKEFAIREGNPHIVTTEYGTNLQGDFGDAQCPSGEYLVEKLTDQNRTPMYTLKDKLGRTLAKKVGPIESGGNEYQTVKHLYDHAGNLIKVLLPNQFVPPKGSDAHVWEISMIYDFLAQMISRTTPDSGTEKYIYDRVGRARFMVDAVGAEASTILYKKYDRLGRVIEEGWFSGEWRDGTHLRKIADTDPSWPAQPEAYTWRKRYLYDGDGTKPYLVGRLHRVLSSTQGGGEPDVEEVYGYDRFGNVVSKTLTVTGYGAHTVEYVYDNLGNVTSIRYPENRGSKILEVVYTYDQLGQAIGVGTPEDSVRFASYTYNADGSIASAILNNGGSRPIMRSSDYNSPGWPLRIRNEFADKSLIMEQTLSYCAGGYNEARYFNGNIAKVGFRYGNWNNHPEDYEYKLQYDNLGRLQIAQNTKDALASLGLKEPTAYDLNGNIQKMEKGKVSDEYRYIRNTDKVENVLAGGDHQNQVYIYDPNGNVITAAHRNISNIVYDPLTHLTTAVQLGGKTQSVVAFKYGDRNQRVLKILRDSSADQATAKLYVHGMNEYPLLEVGSDPAQYIYGPEGLLAMCKSGTLCYVLKDHQGSTRVVVDEAGTPLAAFDYLPFGDLMRKPYGNSGIISYRYTGQEYDPELQLYNYRARFYDSTLGRFYATDRSRQFASPYLYCGNDPINRVDPKGEFAFLAILGIAALIGALVGGGIAAAKGIKEGLGGWKLFGYIMAGAGIGAVAGAASAAGGVVAFAAGGAAAASASSIGVSYAVGTLAGVGVGAEVGTAVGIGQSAAEFGINKAFGIRNQGSLGEVILRGAVTGMVAGAITGGITGAAGAFTSLTQAVPLGDTTWFMNLERVSEGYRTLTSGVILARNFYFLGVPKNMFTQFIFSQAFFDITRGGSVLSGLAKFLIAKAMGT